jgi:CRP-like cAMP-binding protein
MQRTIAGEGGAVHAKVVGRVRARDTFGEASFVLARPSPVSYVASSDETVVYVLDAGALHTAFGERRALAGRFFCYAASRLAAELASSRAGLLARFRPPSLDDAAEEEAAIAAAAAEHSAASTPRHGTLTRFSTPASIKQVCFWRVVARRVSCVRVCVL